MRPDDPRQMNIRRELEASIAMAQTMNAQRGLAGEPPIMAAVCQGPGRCLVPGGSKDAAVCAFCSLIEVGPGTHREVESIARRIIGGN